MSSEGIFSKWQPHYAEKRIATFPVGHDKRPQIKRWNRTRAQRLSETRKAVHGGQRAWLSSRIAVANNRARCRHTITKAFLQML